MTDLKFNQLKEINMPIFTKEDFEAALSKSDEEIKVFISQSH